MTQPKLILDSVKMKNSEHELNQEYTTGTPMSSRISTYNPYGRKTYLIKGLGTKAPRNKDSWMDTLDMDSHVEAVQNNLQWDLAYQMANVIFVPFFIRKW